MRRTLLLTVALSVVRRAGRPRAQQPEGRRSTTAASRWTPPSVPVRTILAEWGKIGGTKVVGAERITGAPLTVKLINVTEAQALETILRSVAGYMAAPRNTGSRRVDVRPHPGDGDAVHAAAAAADRRTRRHAAATEQRLQRHAAFRSAAPAAANRTNQTRGTSRMRIRRTRRSSRSRSRARTAS